MGQASFADPTPYRHPENHPVNWKDDKVEDPKDSGKEDPSEGDGQDEDKSGDKLEVAGNPWEDSYNQYRRHTDKQITALTNTVKELQDKNAQLTRSARLPATAEQVTDWMENYPEIVKVVKGLIDREAENIESRTNEQIQTLERDLDHARQDTNLARLRALVPTFDKLKNDENFHKWLGKKPGAYQALVYEQNEDVEAAAEVFNAYVSYAKKRSKSASKEENSELVRPTAQAPQLSEDDHGGKKIWRESDLNEMLRADPKFWTDELEQEIDVARMEGRFVQDVTGRS